MLQNPPYYTTEAYNSNLQKRVRNQESCSPVCVVCVCVCVRAVLKAPFCPCLVEAGQRPSAFYIVVFA